MPRSIAARKLPYEGVVAISLPNVGTSKIVAPIAEGSGPVSAGIIRGPIQSTAYPRCTDLARKEDDNSLKKLRCGILGMQLRGSCGEAMWKGVKV